MNDPTPRERAKKLQTDLMHGSNIWRSSEVTNALETAIAAAVEQERGASWRTFWDAFSEFLDLGHTQRTYSWHELMDACQKGMDAVKERS